MTHTKKKTKAIFWGTPELCLPYLESLKEATELVAVVTAPDRPVGRKQTMTPPTVKVWAEENNIEILQPEKLTKDFQKTLEDLNVDISIVVAYGRILPQEIIDTPEYGTLNVHYSLLPRWRGASPVEAAILAGDTETGVAIQKMVYELDAGDLVASEFVELYGNEFSEDLKSVLSEAGTRLLIETIPEYISGNIALQEQDEELVTKCRIIKKSEGEIKLDEDPEILWRKYRAYKPWPGIFFFDPSTGSGQAKTGKRIKITEAEFVDGEFRILKVVPEGKKEIKYSEYKQ